MAIPTWYRCAAAPPFVSVVAEESLDTTPHLAMAVLKTTGIRRDGNGSHWDCREMTALVARREWHFFDVLVAVDAIAPTDD